MSRKRSATLAVCLLLSLATSCRRFSDAVPTVSSDDASSGSEVGEKLFKLLTRECSNGYVAYQNGSRIFTGHAVNYMPNILSPDDTFYGLQSDGAVSVVFKTADGQERTWTQEIRKVNGKWYLARKGQTTIELPEWVEVDALRNYQLRCP